MGRAAKSWVKRVRPHFDFLGEAGFRLDRVDDEWWATTVNYVSSALGVKVTRSVEFDRVEISLLRLVDGRIPEQEVWVTDGPMNRMLFDNVLIARAPHLAEELPSGLSESDVEKQLRFWAEQLRSVAPEFLRGDDAAMIEAEQVVRQRVAENPQVITVWLPSDASDEEEAKAREKAERSAPPEVRVVTRRYKR
jgi:hypothetical protein